MDEMRTLALREINDVPESPMGNKWDCDNEYRFSRLQCFVSFSYFSKMLKFEFSL